MRGQNPEPLEGWPWSLTEYEVAYIAAFRVRPSRAGSWSRDPHGEALLDQESAGVLSQVAAPKQGTRRGMPAVVFFPVAGALLVFALAAGLGSVLISPQVASAEGHLAELVDELESSAAWIEAISAEIREDYLAP